MGGLRPRVLKFGGTSVGSAEALHATLDITAKAAREAPLVVVVSALAGVTDALEAALAGAAAARLDVSGFSGALQQRHVGLLGSVASGRAAQRALPVVRQRVVELQSRLRAVAAARGAPPPSARAEVLALGERLSVPIVAAALATRGLEAQAVDGGAVLRTDAAFGEANVDYAATRPLARATLGRFAPGAVPVVGGFVAATADGRTTVLGRGGSDLTAAVLGWALDAERVEIWSDVPGVMTADPRTSAGARTLPRLSYAEATALARGGAKVLHPRTLERLEEAAIPVFVGDTRRPDGAGTWIGAAATALDEAEQDGTAA